MGTVEVNAAEWQEISRKARLWDDLEDARRRAEACPSDGWKAIAREQGVIAGTRACRGELGISLREARDCVDSYLRGIG